jgi:hypothetical protein
MKQGSGQRSMSVQPGMNDIECRQGGSAHETCSAAQ